MKQFMFILGVYLTASFAAKQFNPWYWSLDGILFFGMIVFFILLTPVMWNAMDGKKH